MKYVSTRGKAPVLSFDDVLLTGLARDGGLYLPEAWPQFSANQIRAMQGKSYVEVAREVMTPFVSDVIPEADFAEIVEKAYARFEHPAIAPMKQLDGNLWLMELFHGPTLAFKDYALQLVGHLFDYVLTKRGEKVTIVGATSGDTGSAAIEACRDRDAIEVFILHPEGRVSEVQRRQMTTVLSSNIHNIALKGTFDDCQDAVKAMFNDLEFRDAYKLGAVNSINWARIMAQIVYYFYAATRIGSPDRTVRFSVPTGNFGNVFAGYAARKMGLPIEKFIVGSNRNDILTRYFETGTMAMDSVEPSLSPSMDIQISSNFERLLADVYKGEESALTQAMAEFRDTGSVSFGDGRWKQIVELFEGHRLTDEMTLQKIKRAYARTGELLDPHSIIGVVAARMAGVSETATIALATAHPAKFPDAVERATGVRPGLPPHMGDLFDREERFEIISNDLDAVKTHISSKVDG